ncbi:MAG TPA: gliding motility-associated C-terminal domain-containing protein, partial [Chitinophagales bacterium]|nr:gliding motility-associated C-terminal domain-containing protein [Chitinophagales bacterium]
FSATHAQQQILLLTEGFDGPSNSFNFNAGGVGTNTGNNSWIVNNAYDGAPLYPATPRQDSVVSGNINGAPFSKYLHIHDSVAVGSNGVSNCNWNTNTASDRFTFLGNSFCTLGMSNVIFTFFWICEGVPSNAYGEVYYRIDGGPWIKTGQAEYSGQSKWKYEVIQDPAFDNVQNLQMGFRWVNAGNGGTSNISFGIDDIIAVGTFNSNPNNPASVSINLLIPTTVCQDNFLTIGYSLSQPLCDGTYRIEMSDASGNFGTPFNGGVFTVFAPDTNGFIGFQVPDNVAGTCFKVRINRLSPDPQIVGTASACFTIVDCPETITTVGAPVMNDADTTCLLSVIDVKFTSIGVFGPGTPVNVYRAQLSDSNGSFASPYQLGTLSSDQAYPGPPGTISGLIPANVPPGCGYYIRVVSTLPAVIGTVIGPFCLTQCDELTNNHTDLSFCIQSGPNPLCQTLNIKPNEWNNDASYDTCNKWTIELRSMMTFGLVNSGGLGVYHDSVGGNFTLCMPSVRDSLPVAPGAYYMRIVSTCSNQPWGQTGSVIRVTIGAPDTTAPDILLDDTVECNDLLVGLTINPFNHPPSDYEWASNILNNGNPFIWEYNPLLVDFSTAPPNPGTYIFYVREKNFGCFGPYSAAGRLTLITKPVPTISGPIQVCLGDTVTYNVGYLAETYYNWDAPDGVSILDEANSQTTVIFDSLGTFTLRNFSLNDCGGDSGTYNVNVVTLFNVNAGDDKQACAGDTVELRATSGDLDKLFTTSDTATAALGRPGAMFNIIAHGDVIIDSFAVKYSTAQPIKAEIYGKGGSYRTFEQSQFSWNQLGAYNNFLPSPVGQFTVIPVQVNQAIANGDTFAFYVTTTNTAPVVNQAYSPGNNLSGTVYKSDGIIDFVQGTANNYPFGAFIGPRVVNIRIYYSTKAGLSYYWNTGDTTPVIRFPATQDALFYLQVADTSGCKNRDTVALTVNPVPVVDAGPDTLICAGSNYVMQGVTTAPTIEWTPADGLSATDVLNPVWNNNQPARYYLRGTDAIGCSSIDSMFINVITISVNAGADTSLCDGETVMLQATASTSNVQWTPATGLSDVTILNPQFNNATGVEYILIATDSGCTVSDTVKIDIGACESYLKVPQAFTPGNDGNNDRFIVFGKNIEQYEIRIYNRWGEIVYNSRDLSELNTGGWDGTYKGAMQQVGTFVYYITARDRNGKLLEKKGNLTLIR